MTVLFFTFLFYVFQVVFNEYVLFVKLENNQSCHWKWKIFKINIFKNIEHIEADFQLQCELKFLKAPQVVQIFQPKGEPWFIPT